MDRKEFQYKGKKFSLYWDSKDQILFLEMWGAHNKKDAEEFKIKIEEFLKKFPETEPLNNLVDALRVTKVDHEARRVYTESTKRHQLPANIAVCCGNIILRVIAGFITAATIKRVNVKFFATVEDGLKWLRKIEVKKRQPLNF